MYTSNILHALLSGHRFQNTSNQSTSKQCLTSNTTHNYKVILEKSFEAKYTKYTDTKTNPNVSKLALVKTDA